MRALARSQALPQPLAQCLRVKVWLAWAVQRPERAGIGGNT
jgi:hypothetical protein